MKTIEERAHEYAKNKAGKNSWNLEGTKGMIYIGSKSMYEEIASEQKSIDIDYACDYWFSVLENVMNAGLAYNCVTNFRKAMEEEQ